MLLTSLGQRSLPRPLSPRLLLRRTPALRAHNSLPAPLPADTGLRSQLAAFAAPQPGDRVPGKRAVHCLPLRPPLRGAGRPGLAPGPFRAGERSRAGPGAEACLPAFPPSGRWARCGLRCERPPPGSGAWARGAGPGAGGSRRPQLEQSFSQRFSAREHGDSRVLEHTQPPRTRTSLRASRPPCKAHAVHCSKHGASTVPGGTSLVATMRLRGRRGHAHTWAWGPSPARPSGARAHRGRARAVTLSSRRRRRRHRHSRNRCRPSSAGR